MNIPNRSFSYGKAVERPPERRLHLLVPIVNDVAELLGLENNPDIEWQNEIPHNLEVSADSEQLFRVIMNLCRNSIQAMASNDESSMIARLKMQAQRKDNTVILRISDTGPGIPARIREKLFQPFEGSANPGGTGLGLAIAAELVKSPWWHHRSGIHLLHRRSSFESAYPIQKKVEVLAS